MTISSNQRCAYCLDGWREGFLEDDEGGVFCSSECERMMRVIWHLSAFDRPGRAFATEGQR